MQFRIDGNPDHGDLTVALDPGEKVLAEGGAMSRMNRHMDLRIRARGGLLASFGRKLLGGQSFFLGEYSCPSGGWMSLAPRLPGTVLQRRLDGDSFPSMFRAVANRGVRCMFRAEYFKRSRDLYRFYAGGCRILGIGHLLRRKAS